MLLFIACFMLELNWIITNVNWFVSNNLIKLLLLQMEKSITNFAKTY